MAALCYRLHKLEILTPWKYRDFCVAMSKSGLNKNEPDPIRREQSVVWKKVLSELWRDQKTHYDIAEDLSLPADEVEGLIFGLLPRLEIPQSKKSTGSYLRLVTSWYFQYLYLITYFIRCHRSQSVPNSSMNLVYREDQFILKGTALFAIRRIMFSIPIIDVRWGHSLHFRNEICPRSKAFLHLSVTSYYLLRVCLEIVKEVQRTSP